MHLPTLLIVSLPKRALVGLDLLALTASSQFSGFTSLPSGWHFLFVGANQDFSPRQGIWLRVPDPEDEGLSDARRAGQKRQRSDSHPLGIRGENTRLEANVPANPSTEPWLNVFRWDGDTEQLALITGRTQVEKWRQMLLSSTELQKKLLYYQRSILPTNPNGIKEVKIDNNDRGDGDVVQEAAERPFAEPLQKFPSLTRHISALVLGRICGPSMGGLEEVWSLDTTSSTRADVEAERISGLTTDEQVSDGDLSLLHIDLKVTWPAGALGRERTAWARDRSWKLDEVVNSCLEIENGREGDDIMSAEEAHDTVEMKANDSQSTEAYSLFWGTGLLGEFEFCFLMMLCLSNWSCLSQWRRILELCLTCEVAISQRPEFFAEFLHMLELQLRHTGLIDGGLLDFEAEDGDLLKKFLRRFGNNLADQIGDNTSGNDRKKLLQAVESALAGVKNAVHDQWGWKLDDVFVKRGFVQLEDGELVELEMDGDDCDGETGEYAPAVVEM